MGSAIAPTATCHAIVTLNVTLSTAYITIHCKALWLNTFCAFYMWVSWSHIFQDLRIEISLSVIFTLKNYIFTASFSKPPKSSDQIIEVTKTEPGQRSPGQDRSSMLTGCWIWGACFSHIQICAKFLFVNLSMVSVKH